ncbi:MAG: hypothetical protein KQI78_12985 [Deltaproteobacteria bacterium]|nr:hypothetical protein [Deltaproteobacteria bacterium]
MNTDIALQTKAAFDFIEKLYLETSYLVKEIEGILYEEEERFVIGRPSGYHVSFRTSLGLETNNVKFWFPKKFGVFFVPEEETKLKGGQTFTPVRDDLKLIYLKVLFNDSKERVPTIFSGVLYDIWKRQSDKTHKFEHLMGPIQYKDDRIFANGEAVSYEDPTLRLKGKFLKNHLFEMTNSQALVEKIVNPTLDLYRNLNP